MIRPDHDTIWYAIRFTRYDMFRNTFAILSWEAEACDPGLRSEAPHSTYYNCLRSNDAQWLQHWRPPQSFQMQCVCDEFTCVIGIYCGISYSLLTLVCVTTVPYRIFLRAYRDMYRSLCTGGIPVCRCIVSALICDIVLSIIYIIFLGYNFIQYMYLSLIIKVCFVLDYNFVWPIWHCVSSSMMSNPTYPISVVLLFQLISEDQLTLPLRD